MPLCSRLLEHKAGIPCRWSKVFTDSKQLVIFANPLCSAQRSGLDLSNAGRNGQVGDCSILGLSASVTYNRCPAGSPGHIYRFQRLGECSYLVWLYQYRIRTVELYSFCHAFGIGYKQIVPNQFDFSAEFFIQLYPASPILLPQPTFNGGNTPSPFAPQVSPYRPRTTYSARIGR